MYKEYFISQYPKEGVGYIKKGKFYPVPNIHPEPENNFRVDPKILLKKPEILLHSHCIPKTPTSHDYHEPSYEDLKGQIDTGIEWGICVTDGEVCEDPICWGNPDHRPPLIERPFIHSVQDCLCLVQDWYYETQKIKLKTHPREPDWWVDKPDRPALNLMEDMYKDWGFEEVPLTDLQIGDVLMYQVRSNVVNHLGIYIGGSNVLSHWFGRLSEIHSIGLWRSHIKLAVRYKGL